MIKQLTTLFLISLSFFASAQNKITELSIGDRCPDVLLASVLNNSGKPLKLSDFKGKMIILDFMRVNCSGCIAAFPKIKQLQQQFKSRLQFIVVTIDSKKQWTELIQKNNTAREYNLPVVVSDNILSSYFRYQYIPHEVWLDENRIVKAITTSEYITASNIQSLLDKKEMNWPVKKDVGDYSFDEAMLSLADGEHFNLPLYYTAFTGYRAGTNPARQITADSAGNYFRFTVINQTIPSLYFWVLKETDILAKGRNRFLVEVSPQDSTYLFPDKRTTYADRWSSENKFCFEAIYPLALSAEERNSAMIACLNSVTGFNGNLQQRKQTCYVIIKKPGTQEIKTGEKSQAASSGVVSFSTFDELAWEWNISASNPVMLNEAGTENIAHLKFERKTTASIEALKEQLNQYGFDIIKAEREIEIFLVTKK